MKFLAISGTVLAFVAVLAASSGFSDGTEVDAELPFDSDDECASRGDPSCALSALQMRAASNSSSAAGRPEYTVGCFSYTGATCITGACAASRKAACHDGKCLCSGCAGPDGSCYGHRNRKIASGFTLSNAYWPKYKMYFQRVSAFGQLATTSASSFWNHDQDKFDLWELPGHTNGDTRYFLASQKWPEYVVAVRATAGTALSPFGVYAVNLDDKASILNAWGPANMMLKVCMLGPHSPYHGYIKFGSDAPGTTVWGYIHHGSYLVYGSMTSPGTGGLWKASPSLRAGTLPECAN